MTMLIMVGNGEKCEHSKYVTVCWCLLNNFLDASEQLFFFKFFILFILSMCMSGRWLSWANLPFRSGLIFAWNHGDMILSAKVLWVQSATQNFSTNSMELYIQSEMVSVLRTWGSTKILNCSIHCFVTVLYYGYAQLYQFRQADDEPWLRNMVA